MTKRTDHMFPFLRSPAIARSLLSPHPTMVWARDGSRILFGNAAALTYLRVPDQQALQQRRYSDDHPLRREISRLASGRPGKAGMASLRFSAGAGPADIANCERINIDRNERILVVTLHRRVPQQSSQSAARALEATGLTCAIVDDAGRADLLVGDRQAVDRMRDPIAEAARNACRFGAFSHGLWLEDQTPVGELIALDSVQGRFLAILDDRHLLPKTVQATDDVRWAPGDPGCGRSSWRQLSPAVAWGPADETEGGPSRPERRQSLQKQQAAPTGHASDGPVRFLWQTDDQNRFLFVSKGLEQVVGGGANVIGETWHAACERLDLDPSGGITAAMSRHDEWGGLVAYWPTEGADRRIPAELNASPVFGADRSFKGFRGFGVLRPAEAVPMQTPCTGSSAGSEQSEGLQPADMPRHALAYGLPKNVVPLHSDEGAKQPAYRFAAAARGAPLALDAVAAAFGGWPQQDELPVASSQLTAPAAQAVPVPVECPSPPLADTRHGALEALGERTFSASEGVPSAFALPIDGVSHVDRPENHSSEDRELIRQNAERASQEKSDFLARVSHEIRTPLNAIIGFAEVMIGERFGPLENARYCDYLRDIRTSGEHVLSLVNDLLDISKIEAGRLDLETEDVDLNAVVAECSAVMQPQAGQGRVIVRTSLSPDVPPVRADSRTLRQIILNLLSNAVKFTGPGGQVILSSQLSREGEVMLRIRDTGKGMSEAELERALEPFRQLSSASLGGSAGSGLGLPLTKALIEANGASLAISSSPGEGTIVRVTFAGDHRRAGAAPD